MNWRGRPLTSHGVIVQTIAATTTRTGLRVHAELDASTYDTGIKVSDGQVEALPLTPTTGTATGTTPCAPNPTTRRSAPRRTRSTSPVPTWPGCVTRP